MQPQLKNEIVIESQDSGFDVAEVAKERSVSTMVEQIERDLKKSSTSLKSGCIKQPNWTRKGRRISSVGLPIYFANVSNDF